MSLSGPWSAAGLSDGDMLTFHSESCVIKKQRIKDVDTEQLGWEVSTSDLYHVDMKKRSLNYNFLETI